MKTGFQKRAHVGHRKRRRHTADYGTLKNIVMAEGSEDVREACLYGVNDDKLCKIDDVLLLLWHASTCSLAVNLRSSWFTTPRERHSSLGCCV